MSKTKPIKALRITATVNIDGAPLSNMEQLPEAAATPAAIAEVKTRFKKMLSKFGEPVFKEEWVSPE